MVLPLLDAHPGDGVPALGSPWEAQVERSLRQDPSGWTAEALSVGRAWVLLGWVEDAATRVVRSRDRELLRTAVSALVVVAAGPLDRRDVWVVAGLLRRAADLAGLRWDHAVDQLPGEPHPVGGVPADTPPTHEEVGAGSTFAFRRRPRSFDPVALERRLSRARPC